MRAEGEGEGERGEAQRDGTRGPSSQALVSFHGATLVTAIFNGEPHAAVRPISDHLGLVWSGQYRRIKRHGVLKGCVAIMATRLSNDPRTRSVVMLPVRMLHGWLFGVQTNSVRPDLRELLVAYQRECFNVLDAYWRGGVAVNPRLRALPDDQPWLTPESAKTRGERFAEERARWERDAGRSLVGVLDFTKPKLRAVEQFDTSLTKGDLLEKLGLLAFDIHYILTGERIQTDVERAMRDGYRLGTDDDRKQLRRHVEAIQIVPSPEGWNRQDDDARGGMFAGADTVRYLPAPM